LSTISCRSDLATPAAARDSPGWITSATRMRA
jgi:hypothetical protein